MAFLGEQARGVLRKRGLGESARSPVLIFSKQCCPHSQKVVELFGGLGVRASVVEVDIEAQGADIYHEIKTITKQNTVPNTFIGDTHIGGCDAAFELLRSGKLASLLISRGARNASKL